MHLVEVREGFQQLRQQGGRIARVQTGHVVSLERVDKALGRAVALRVTIRRVDLLAAQ